jgi:hypothetical protein
MVRRRVTNRAFLGRHMVVVAARIGAPHLMDSTNTVLSSAIAFLLVGAVMLMRTITAGHLDAVHFDPGFFAWGSVMRGWKSSAVLLFAIVVVVEPYTAGL